MKKKTKQNKTKQNTTIRSDAKTKDDVIARSDGIGSRREGLIIWKKTAVIIPAVKTSSNTFIFNPFTVSTTQNA